MRRRFLRKTVSTWLPMILLLGAATYLAHFLHSRFADSIVRQFLEEEMTSVRDAARSIESRLQIVMEDLSFLSDIPELSDLVSASEEAERHLANVRYAFLSFAYNRKIYFRIVYADERGRERVRVERRRDRILMAPEEELRDVAAAPFFKPTSQLPRGGIYVSDLELESEPEAAEPPFRPVVRFATPIYDDLNNKRGVLLFTVDAGYFLRQITASRMWLLNEKSEFFAHPKSSKLYTKSPPGPAAESEWMGVRVNEFGEQELLAYTRVNVGPGHTWTVGKTSAYSDISQPIRRNALQTWGIYASVLAILAVFGFQLRRAEKQRIRAIEEMKYVSSRLELERRLREADALYRDIVENSPEMIFQLDKERRFLSVNSTALDRLGYSLTEMQGKRLEDIVPETYREEVIRHHQRVMETGHSQLSTVFLTKNGEEVLVDIDATAVYDALNGAFVSTRSFVRDVTDKRRLERQLLQSEKLATVGQLAAGIAHEVGTPLNVILNNAEFLLAQLPPDAAQRKELEVVVSETERVSRLVRQLLEFSRPSRLELRPLDINEVVRETLSLAATQIEKAGVQVVTALEPTLPRIRGDHNQLKQLFLNIIMNAVQAMPQGGRLTVETGLTRAVNEYGPTDRDYVEITLSDTGHGIAPEHLGKIFEPFFSTKDPGQGTGLGLAVCARIVQLHNGTIEAKSQVGKGSTFYVRLPVDEAKS